MTSAPRPRLADCCPAAGGEPRRAAIGVLVAVVLTSASLGPLPQCALRRRYAWAVKSGAVGTRRYGDAQPVHLQEAAVVDTPLQPLARALDLFGGLVASVGPDQWSVPTPCDAWNVQQLVGH